MANPKHLKILRQGLVVWCKWRQENPDIRQDLSEADLNGALLSGADLHTTNLFGAHLNEADLRFTNLIQTYLSEANLIDAHLIGAHLISANLSSANLSGANLADSNLIGTNLMIATLQEANFTNAHTGYTVFADNDLSTVKGVGTVIHDGPSTIGIDTIRKSGGNIPEIFLRGCGVPETFITYARSLIGKAIDFYSCFISFTEADDAISEWLHNDLQAKGVRCWR